MHTSRTMKLKLVNWTLTFPSPMNNSILKRGRGMKNIEKEGKNIAVISIAESFFSITKDMLIQGKMGRRKSTIF